MPSVALITREQMVTRIRMLAKIDRHINSAAEHCHLVRPIIRSICPACRQVNSLSNSRIELRQGDGSHDQAAEADNSPKQMQEPRNKQNC